MQRHLQKHLRLLEMPEVGTLITGYREPLSVYPEIWITQASKDASRSLSLGRFHGKTEWELFTAVIDVIILAAVTQRRSGSTLRRSEP
jgi:hypothetical protein